MHPFPFLVSITASATVGYSTWRWSLWAEAPIHNRQPRRCGNSPEHVSFHHSSPREDRGGRATGLADRLGPLWPLSITVESMHASCLRCSSAVAWSRGNQGWPTPWSRP